MKRLLLVPLLALPLAGCQGDKPVASIGGECKLAHTPSYAVKGRTTFDQGWIDDTTEALVRGCKQPRPQTRPAELDKEAPKTPGTAKAAPPAPATLRWWQHLKK